MKVNDYVRTEWGDIERIVRVDNDNIIVEIEEDEDGRTYSKMCYKEGIIKSSPNIIDLIEEGDIVNYGLLGGGMVIFKKDGEITTNTILFSTLKEKDIKKIITKEQIENMEYEVK